MVQVVVAGRQRAIVRNEAGTGGPIVQVGGHMTDEQVQRLMRSWRGKNPTG